MRQHLSTVPKGTQPLNINIIILSHPANCQFLKNSDNARKHTKSQISIEELYERIKNYK